MTLNFVHFQVPDLPTAVDWFASVLELKLGFQDERIATFIFGAMTIIIDTAMLILRRRSGSKAMTAIFSKGS
jgi:hypothetical protein